MKTDFDVIIVGARIAGSITATLLGEYGYKVLLLNRARFPSDTLSTHFFRSPALKAFQRAGVFEQVQSVAPHMVGTGHRSCQPACCHACGCPSSVLRKQKDMEGGHV